MAYNIAVNGYGRIGRCVVRALYESEVFRQELRLVAVNETSHPDKVFHLTRFDSTHGRFPGKVNKMGGYMEINGDRILVLQEKEIEQLPWKKLGVDMVLDCTGMFNDRQAALRHLNAGASKVLYSHPAKDEMDATIIYGINHHSLKSEHCIISNASCTSNCLIPILKVIDTHLGIDAGSVTTIHSAMNDQPVIDAYNDDLRKTRSALHSIIPVSTSLARGIGRVLPHLDNRFETLAIRVPTTNVSIMDITLSVTSDTSTEQVNELLVQAANTRLQGVLGVSDEQLVSCDFNHDARSAIVDLPQTRVSGSRLVKIQAWFDNEWGYSNRMLDTAIAAMKVCV